MPYNYGVTDCSFYAQTVYAPYVALPRVSRAQYRFKQTNRLPILQPLSFFTFRPDKQISHVGLLFADTLYHNSVKNKQAVKVPYNSFWKERTVRCFERPQQP